MRSGRVRVGRWWAAVIVAALAMLAAGLLGGCAGLGMTGGEVELIDASAADARFVERYWTSLGEAERREFVGENARRWGYFSDLVHGRRPAQPAAGNAEVRGDE